MRHERYGSTPGPCNNDISIIEERKAQSCEPNGGGGDITACTAEGEASTLAMVDIEGQKESSSTKTNNSEEEAREEEEEEEETYPEGGLQAWLVTFGAWSAMVIGLGLVNFIGSLQAYISANQLQSYSEATVSWIFSLYTFCVFFFGLQIGPVFDAKGPRALVFGGSVLCVACMMLLGLCTAYWHFIVVFSLVGGLGSSLLFTPAVATVAHFFRRRRSTATGLATTGGAIGGVVFPLAFQSLIPKVGFAWTTRIIGFIFLFLSALANLLIRSRLPPKQGTRASSVLPDLYIFWDGDGAFALVTAGTFFMELSLFVPIGYLTSYCLASGVDPTFSYQIIAILNAGSAFGRYLPGLMADRLGRFNTMIAMLLLCLVTVFGFWLPASGSEAVVPLVVVFAVLYGFASGSNISLTPTCIGQLCPTTQYGRYYATCYTVVSFATLIGIPIGGALIEACNGEYWGLIVFTGLGYVASLACFITVRVRRVGCRLTANW